MPNMTANAPALPGVGRTVRWVFSATALAAATLSLTACPSITNMSLQAAYHPPSARKVQPVTPPGSPPLKLYAGDSNFHMPEGEFRMRPDIRRIVDNIQKSGLDFVFFTPRVKSKFYETAGGIEEAVQKWKDMRQFLDTIPDPKPLFLPGVEYHDRSFGSVSLLFLDFPSVFSELRFRDFKGSPPLFFYTAKAYGALISINTPLATPINVPVDTHEEKYATRDHSWRPITDAGRGIANFPPEIQAANELAYGLEAYSLPVAVWRDQYGLEDAMVSLKATLQEMDQQMLKRGRRMVPLAGSDSRGRVLHPTMFIAAPSRTPQALREGLLRGRVCVRSPEPCGLRVYADDDAIPQGLGAALRARQRVEFDWKGEGELIKNGTSVGTFEGHATIAADPQCSIYRLVLDGGFSGPVYVNCPWAETELPL